GAREAVGDAGAAAQAVDRLARRITEVRRERCAAAAERRPSSSALKNWVHEVQVVPWVHRVLVLGSEPLEPVEPHEPFEPYQRCAHSCTASRRACATMRLNASSCSASLSGAGVSM